MAVQYAHNCFQKYWEEEMPRLQLKSVFVPSCSTLHPKLCFCRYHLKMLQGPCFLDIYQYPWQQLNESQICASHIDVSLFHQIDFLLPSYSNLKSLSNLLDRFFIKLSFPGETGALITSLGLVQMALIPVGINDMVA